jgi:hypothetical protein
VCQLEATIARVCGQDEKPSPVVLNTYATHFARRDQQSRLVCALTALVNNTAGMVWTTYADSYDSQIDSLLAELVAAGCVRRRDMRCSVHFTRVRPADLEKARQEHFGVLAQAPAAETEYTCPDDAHEQTLMAALMATLDETSSGAALNLIDYGRLRPPAVYTHEKMYVFTRYWVN